MIWRGTMDGHHDLYLTVGEIRSDLRHTVLRIERLEAETQAMREKSGGGLLDVLQRAGSIKQMVTALFIAVLAIKGILTPADVKALILSYLGG